MQEQQPVAMDLGRCCAQLAATASGMNLDQISTCQACDLRRGIDAPPIRQQNLQLAPTALQVRQQQRQPFCLIEAGDDHAQSSWSVHASQPSRSSSWSMSLRMSSCAGFRPRWQARCQVSLKTWSLPHGIE